MLWDMADWLTRGLNALADAVQYALDKLEQSRTQKTTKRFAQAPVANRWYNTWREQKGLEPLDDAPNSTERQLSDQELDTLLASFYGAKAISRQQAQQLPANAAQTAKQRLLNIKTLPDANPYDHVKADYIKTQQTSYISRIASVVKTPEDVASPGEPTSNQHGKLSSPLTMQPLHTGIPTQISPQSVPMSAKQPPKPFATPQAVDNTWDMQPNPLAHLVANNQFLSDRLNRLANQYFEEKALEEATEEDKNSTR
jgi:hypothetical protein